MNAYHIPQQASCRKWYDFRMIKRWWNFHKICSN